MKKLLLLAMGVIFLLGVSVPLFAQPEPTMYTLGDTYYYLIKGTEATGHTLEPPAGATPGDTRFKTLGEIYNDIKTLFDQVDATAADVAEGKLFFSTQTDNWGVQTGTRVPLPWYEVNGPAGLDKVVLIGTMYVAKWVDNEGTANNGRKNWDNACSWGTSLNWLGKDDWHLPTKDEQITICANKADLGAFTPDGYWTSTEDEATEAWHVFFFNCTPYDDPKIDQLLIRAVRDAE